MHSWGLSFIDKERDIRNKHMLKKNIIHKRERYTQQTVYLYIYICIHISEAENVFLGFELNSSRRAGRTRFVQRVRVAHRLPGCTGEFLKSQLDTIFIV